MVSTTRTATYDVIAQIQEFARRVGLPRARVQVSSAIHDMDITVCEVVGRVLFVRRFHRFNEVLIPISLDPATLFLMNWIRITSVLHELKGEF